MTGRYIPPSLRRQNQEANNNEPPKRIQDDEKQVSLEEIKNHFWPAKDGDDAAAGRFAPGGNSKTLHDSAARPGKLAYIILFHLANPRRNEDHIVFTKSSLELLPQGLAHEQAVEGTQATSPGDATAQQKQDDNPAISKPDGRNEPIAVFTENRKGFTARSCVFDGWYDIDRLTFVEPNSPELVRMLEQKWTKKDKRGNVIPVHREGPKWKESMSYRWAIIKLKKLEIGMEPPKIERLPDQDSGSAKKSVNEMLAEMRMAEKRPEEGLLEPELSDIGMEARA